MAWQEGRTAVKQVCRHPECGAVFNAIKPPRGRMPFYCSDECRIDYQNSKRHARRQALSFGYRATAYMNSFLLMRAR